MLDPYFFRCPPELNFNLNAPDLIYQVIGYASAAEFTLVSWRFGSAEEYFQGQTLYKNKELLLCHGGTLPLPEQKSIENYQNLMPWDRLSPSLWEIGITQNIAAQLRNNYQAFQI